MINLDYVYCVATKHPNPNILTNHGMYGQLMPRWKFGYYGAIPLEFTGWKAAPVDKCQIELKKYD